MKPKGQRLFERNFRDAITSRKQFLINRPDFGSVLMLDLNDPGGAHFAKMMMRTDQFDFLHWSMTKRGVDPVLTIGVSKRLTDEIIEEAKKRGAYLLPVRQDGTFLVIVITEGGATFTSIPEDAKVGPSYAC